MCFGRRRGSRRSDPRRRCQTRMAGTSYCEVKALRVTRAGRLPMGLRLRGEQPVEGIVVAHRQPPGPHSVPTSVPSRWPRVSVRRRTRQRDSFVRSAEVPEEGATRRAVSADILSGCVWLEREVDISRAPQHARSFGSTSPWTARPWRAFVGELAKARRERTASDRSLITEARLTAFRRCSREESRDSIRG